MTFLSIHSTKICFACCSSVKDSFSLARISFYCSVSVSLRLSRCLPIRDSKVIEPEAAVATKNSIYLREKSLR